VKIRDPRTTAVAALVGGVALGGGEAIREAIQIKRGKREGVSKKKVAAAALTGVAVGVASTTSFGKSNATALELVQGRLSQLGGGNLAKSTPTPQRDDLWKEVVPSAAPTVAPSRTFNIKENLFPTDHPLHGLVERFVGAGEIPTKDLTAAFHDHIRGLNHQEVADIMGKMGHGARFPTPTTGGFDFSAPGADALVAPALRSLQDMLLK